MKGVSFKNWNNYLGTQVSHMNIQMWITQLCRVWPFEYSYWSHNSYVHDPSSFCSCWPQGDAVFHVDCWRLNTWTSADVPSAWLILPHPIHSKEDAGLSLGKAKVRVLETWALLQPGPLELTRLPLRSLFQVVLVEVRVVMWTLDILPLLHTVVVRWDNAGRGKGCKEKGRRGAPINKNTVPRPDLRFRQSDRKEAQNPPAVLNRGTAPTKKLSLPIMHC